MQDKMKQMPLLEAQASWFHVFKSMLDSGDVVKMGPYATTVYLAIKAFTNWKTGKAWPGIELIMEKTGISRAQVTRSLKTLEDLGYLVREKVGRHNSYTLREKVTVYDTKEGDMRPCAEVTWDYLPSTVKSAVAELRNFAFTGDPNGHTVINIQNLTLNLQQVFDNATGNQHNIISNTMDTIDWGKVPDDDPVKRAYLASRKGLAE